MPSAGSSGSTASVKYWYGWRTIRAWIMRWTGSGASFMNADCHTSNGNATELLPDAAAWAAKSSWYGGGTSSFSERPAAGTNALQYTSLRSREASRGAAAVIGYPPQLWPTSVTSCRSSPSTSFATASTTSPNVYWVGSSPSCRPGRVGVSTLAPAARRCCATGRQAHPPCQAPVISTNVSGIEAPRARRGEGVSVLRFGDGRQ
jgi:hypothetical protein